MWKGTLVIALLIAFGDCAKLFELKFSESTNKVVVADYFYKLEYSVYKSELKEVRNLSKSARKRTLIKNSVIKL